MKKIYSFTLSVAALGLTTVFSQQRIASVHEVEKGVIQISRDGSVNIQPSAAADFTPTIWDDNAGKPGTVLGTGTVFTVAQVDTSAAAIKLIGSPVEAAYNMVGVFSTPVTIPTNQIFWAGFTMNYSSGDSAGLVTSNDPTPGDAPGTTGDFPTAQTHSFEQWSDNSWNSLNDGTTNSWQLDIAQAIFPTVALTSGADTLTVHLNIAAGHTPKFFSSSNGGFLSGQNGYGDLAKVQKFDNTMGVTSGGTISSILFWFGGNIESGASVNELSSNIASLSNIPNPATNFTTIKYELNETVEVKISVVDIAGKEIFVQSYGVQTQGKHQSKLDVSSLTSGMYFYSLTAGNNTTTSKMIIAK